MIEFKNTELELQRFQLRLFLAGVFVLLCFCALFARFVWLQIVRYDDYHAQAEDNRISVVPIAPNRGIIADRNGVVLARNYSAYTLEVTPSKLGRDVDAVIDDLAKLVDIQPTHRRKFKKLLEESKTFESLPLRTRLSDEEVARFAAQRFRFPGVEIRARLFREYPLGEVAAHVIGYIGRISERDEERISQWENASDYVGTQYVGKVGVEQSYEKELHGVTGFEEVEVSAGGRAVKTLSRTPAQPGNNLTLSIDIKLQKLVAVQDCGLIINPKTAESQIYGACIMSTCGALMEERIMDAQTGKFLNCEIADYKLPRLGDTGEIVVEFYEPESEYTRGVIGLGEPPVIAPGAAISNAVCNALGVRVPILPMTPKRVVEALAKGGRA